MKFKLRKRMSAYQRADLLAKEAPEKADRRGSFKFQGLRYAVFRDPQGVFTVFSAWQTLVKSPHRSLIKKAKKLFDLQDVEDVMES